MFQGFLLLLGNRREGITMEGQEIISLIRRIRHDFGNHLQVLMGYMDLGYHDEARAYISQVVQEMMAERIIFDCTDPEDVFYFYEQILSARDMGILLQYNKIEVKSVDVLKEKQEPYKSLTNLINQSVSHRDDIKINLSIVENDGA